MICTPHRGSSCAHLSCHPCMQCASLSDFELSIPSNFFFSISFNLLQLLLYFFHYLERAVVTLRTSRKRRWSLMTSYLPQKIFGHRHTQTHSRNAQEFLAPLWRLSEKSNSFASTIRKERRAQRSRAEARFIGRELAVHHPLWYEYRRQHRLRSRTAPCSKKALLPLQKSPSVYPTRKKLVRPLEKNSSLSHTQKPFGWSVGWLVGLS